MSTDSEMPAGQGAAFPGLAVTFVNVFSSPREAFAALAVRPVVLWPLLAILLGHGGLVYAYHLEVDFIWFLETSMQAAGQDLPPGVAERGAGPASAFAGITAGISTAVILLLLMLLSAGYLSFVSTFTGDGIRFQRWLSLVVWASLPTLLDVLAGGVNIALNDFTHRLPTEISALSLGNLLGLDPLARGFLATLLHQTSITSLWALALMVFGYAMWTRKPLAKSFVIVVAPLMLIFGIALLIAAL